MVGKVTRKNAEKLNMANTDQNANQQKPEKKKRGPRKRNPNSVLRRNARERDRIRNVNDAFDSLRSHVPNGDLVKGRKISKVETLKSAIEYIHALRNVLGDEFVPIELSDELMSKSDSESCSETDECKSTKLDTQVESPESGIHSNETSLDYSLKTSSTTPTTSGPIEAMINHDLPDLPNIDPAFFATHLPVDNHTHHHHHHQQPLTSSPSQPAQVPPPPQPTGVFGSEFDSYDFISHQNFLLESGVSPFNTLSFDL